MKEMITGNCEMMSYLYYIRKNPKDHVSSLKWMIDVTAPGAIESYIKILNDTQMYDETIQNDIHSALHNVAHNYAKPWATDD